MPFNWNKNPKKSDEENREIFATVKNSEGEDEPITFQNAHRFITKKSRIQGDYITEASISKAGFSFTLKAHALSVDTSFNKKEEAEKRSLWVPKSSNTEKNDIGDNDSDDGAFDNDGTFDNNVTFDPMPSNTIFNFDLNEAFTNSSEKDSSTDEN